MIAVDYSAFSTSFQPVQVATFRKLRDLFPSGDMLLNIPGGWHGSVSYVGARQSIINAREAGFTHHATYAVVNRRSGKEAVERAQLAVGDEWANLSFIGIDVELETTPQIVLEACNAAVALGVRPYIYTANWAWKQFMQDSRDFAEYRLWNAYYDNDPDVDFWKVPYGGWGMEDVAGEQYTNTTLVEGIGFDFNWFNDAAVPPLAALPDAVPPLVALVEAWRKDMAGLAVNAADLIHTPFDTVRLALHAIFTARRCEAWKSLVGGGK